MTLVRSRSGSSIGRRDLLKAAAIGGIGFAAAGVVGASPATSREDAGSSAATPKKGGNLRIAMLGGKGSDTLDGQNVVTQTDGLRAALLYNSLFMINGEAELVNELAESLEANADATQWTIRLRKGIQFHDGKKVTAEDVAFTFRRIADPKSPGVGKPALDLLDLKNMKVMDDLTLRVPAPRPTANFSELISGFAIIPTDYDPKKPVGTGPFKLKSFVPTQETVVERFEEYWEAGLPHLDTITLTQSFADETAAFNALQGNQVDVFAYAPLTLAGSATQGGMIQAIVSGPGQWTPFTMRVDQSPFNDPNVRRAFRLLVDREQMVKLALNGYGITGADVFSRWDPCYDTELHRERDLDQAKYLLKKAGQEGMSVELVTSDIANSVVQQAQVFAQQAKAAGVTVNVRRVTPDVFFGDQYLKWTFAQDYWNYSPYMSQVTVGYLPTASYNETHWSDPAYLKLYDEAQATLDRSKRCELIHQMQRIDFDRGGYIIASFNEAMDLARTNVMGIRPSKTGVGIGNFRLQEVWLA